MLAARVPLARTWRYRYLRQPAPVLVLDRDYQAGSASAPLPPAYQTGFPAETMDQLPDIVGRIPLPIQFLRLSLALEAGVSSEEIGEGVDWKAPATEAVPVLATANRAQHTNWRVFVEDGVSQQILPDYEWRTYLLIVNEGANDCRIAFDKDAKAEDGLLLASGGGFHELTMGTVSSVSAAGEGGQAELRIVEGSAYPRKACILPCAEA